MLIDPGVVDRDYGPWAGHRQADVEQWFGSLDAAPGVEGSDQFAAAS